MRKIPFLVLFIAGCFHLSAQQSDKSVQRIDKIINAKAVENIEKILAADDMRGRATFSPDIDRAADFIEAQFKAAGLQTLNNNQSYRQPFTQVDTKITSLTGNLDGKAIPTGSVIVVSSLTHLALDENSGYEKAVIRAGDNFQEVLGKYLGKEPKNWLVLIDTSFSNYIDAVRNYVSKKTQPGRNTVFVFTNDNPSHYSITADQEIRESKLANVVGILPGKSRKDEYVIFSAHYDHLGVGSSDSKGDSIFNGANDDASGSTAVIMLARYFATLHNNERTLVFVTFTAEEIGGFGSQYFSKQFDPAAVKAMFNIEMIGTESKWGTNSAYLTGYEKTDMGKILEKNLEGSQFTFHPDPYPDQQLFYRSDNATLAKQGVPAHTLSTSKMDSEKYYHTQGDEIGTLDMNNMARIIKAIAISSRTIIAGTDTPSRVDVSKLR
ncbi:M28 family peptidase [Flavitalea flava]